METEKHYFYGKPVYPDQEQEKIQKILKKYQHEPATEELKKKIWDELQHEKHLGNISIPFKVVLFKDSEGKYPDTVEVILEPQV